MIVRQFLQWVRKAPAGERAEATSALARAYLYSNLSSDDLAAAEGAMIMMLDDPSPLVRRALSDVFATAEHAPRVVVQALAADQPDVALPVLSGSPLLADDDLVDFIATGRAEIQTAIAGRPQLSSPVAAAIAEVGVAEACLVLIENPQATLAWFSFDRIVERFGHLASIRESLMARSDLPATTRQTLLSLLSQKLAGFIVSRHWLDTEQAESTAREACEKATVAIAADTSEDEMSLLVRHLRDSGQLTAGMILRALLSGNIALLEEALSELSDVPLNRVRDYIQDPNVSSFRAIYRKAGLPEGAYPAFREGLAALQEGVLIGEQGGAARLKRRMVERVLDACAKERDKDMTTLLSLLRRFEVEAARDEARLFCDDLLALPPASLMHSRRAPMEGLRLVA